MLGNDLVFLPEMKIPSGNRFDRYLNKVFVGEEQDWIRKTDDKQLVMAWLWSLKESAYKVWAKQTGDRKWNPKQFIVKNYPESLLLTISNFPKSGIGFDSVPVFQSQIQTPLGIMWGNSLFYANYIASYVVDEKKDWPRIYWENDFHSERKTQSERVRVIYQKRIFSTLGLCKKVQIGSADRVQNPVSVKTDPLYTTLTLQQTKQIDLSFSHDGPMIGYAFTINQTLNHEFRTTERTTKS